MILGFQGNNVDYPASSPSAFGCGGTTISPDGRLEVAWSYGGGGVSTVFERPDFQVRQPNLTSASTDSCKLPSPIQQFGVLCR